MAENYVAVYYNKGREYGFPERLYIPQSQDEAHARERFILEHPKGILLDMQKVADNGNHYLFKTFWTSDRRSRVEFDPLWCPSKPWTSFNNGTASHLFENLEDAQKYFRDALVID